MNRNQAKKIAWKGLLYLSAFALLIYLLGPFLWMFFSSISSEKELIGSPGRWLPQKPVFDRYYSLINFWDAAYNRSGGEQFRRAFLNSLIITALATVLTMFFGTLAAYCYARFNFKGKKGMIIGILLTQMLPRAAIVIPLFLFMGYLNLRDTRLGLILVYIGFIMPIVIWILKNYWLSIPPEIEEAAVMDGASTMQILFWIMIPLLTPALFATGLYSLITIWNEFFFALILTGSGSKTVPVAITEFSTQGGVDYGMMATAGVIGSLIPLLIALIFKDFITRGLTAGWSK